MRSVSTSPPEIRKPRLRPAFSSSALVALLDGLGIIFAEVIHQAHGELFDVDDLVADRAGEG